MYLGSRFYNLKFIFRPESVYISSPPRLHSRSPINYISPPNIRTSHTNATFPTVPHRPAVWLTVRSLNSERL